jgi:hypothetical protein
MHTGDRYLEVDVKSGLTIYPLGVGEFLSKQAHSCWTIHNVLPLIGGITMIFVQCFETEKYIYIEV